MRRSYRLALSLFGFVALIGAVSFVALRCGAPQPPDEKGQSSAQAPIAAAVKAAEAAPEPVKKKPSVRLMREPWRPLLHEADVQLGVGANVTLELNTLGDTTSRAAFRDRLGDYLLVDYLSNHRRRVA